MLDLETESLWSHLLGEAMEGPLKGTELDLIPSVLTDWESWTSQHPETSVCMMPRTAFNHRRLEGAALQRLCIGLSADDTTKCWTFSLLHEEPVINSEVGSLPVLVVFDAAHGTALLYNRRPRGRELTFEQRDGALVDVETESRWDRFHGVAVSGELEGRRLQQLP